MKDAISEGVGYWVGIWPVMTSRFAGYVDWTPILNFYWMDHLSMSVLYSTDFSLCWYGHPDDEPF